MNNNDYLVLAKTNENNNQEYNDNNFIEFNINNIFSDEGKTEKERVLCIGAVQSGKTRNIIECIKKACDLNYDLIIFFGGTTEILRSQSEKRLNESFNNNQYNLISKNWGSNLNMFLESNKKAIITVMKTKDSLENIYSSIKGTNLLNKKILLIDDECDYASINTKNQLSPSYIHQKIEEIYNRTYKCKLISFTATPFANILNSKSISDDNFKTKVVVLANYNKYYGLKKFNENKTINYVPLTSEYEQNSEDIYIKWTIFIHIIYIIKKSLNKNLDLFDGFKTECLINIDSSTENHNIYYEKVTKIIKDFNCIPKINFIDNINKLKGFFIKNEYFKDFYQITNDQIENIYFSKFRQVINYFLLNSENKIIILNSNVDYKEKITNSLNHKILIGGVLLSRGVTYENLSTELLLNYPKNEIAIDTLLQRCRWFGNRESNKEYIHIILTHRLIEVFLASEKYIDIFKPGIQNFNDLKNKIKELDLFYKQKNIRSTSSGKSK